MDLNVGLALLEQLPDCENRGLSRFHDFFKWSRRLWRNNASAVRNHSYAEYLSKQLTTISKKVERYIQREKWISDN